MIRIEKTDVYGWEAAIRGMRNPMNSWDKSDSDMCHGADGFEDCTINVTGVCPRHGDFNHDVFCVGKNDHELMMKLAKGGSVHAKYRRMITVTCDITAPLYWWKEFDTYKVGTVANSCSTMHKIHAKEFTLDDFSHEHLIADRPVPCKPFSPLQALHVQIDILNKYREMYIDSGKQQDKEYWWQMIQLLPSSYNQKRTIMMNYEVLVGMFRDRRNHKLDEWVAFCDWIRELPYSEIITGGVANE